MASRGGTFLRWLLDAGRSSLRTTPAPLAHRRSPSLERASAGPDEGLAWLAKITSGTRGIQTDGGSGAIAEENATEIAPQPDCTVEDSNSEQRLHQDGKELSIKYSALSSLKTSSRHDLAMIFTCKVCETRSVKTACRESYEKGIVVARCGGCNNLHLIADRLGWFGEPGTVEEFLAARGEEVKKGSMDTLNLTLEDFAGAKSS